MTSRGFSSFSLPCLSLGLLLFATSLTPSLIPRGPILQGVLGGTLTALGYLLGKIVAVVWHAGEMPRLRPGFGRRTSYLAFGLSCAVLLWTLSRTLTWQNDLRLKMGMMPADSLHLAQIMALALVAFAVWCALGAGIAALFRLVRSWFYVVMPARRANVLAVIAVLAILFVVTRDGIIDVVFAGLDESYEAAQGLFEEAPPAPIEARVTGSPESLVDWSAIGLPGRDFILSGPDAAAISAFTGRPALDPIRVYVGRANGETPRERAELALAELQRLNAFDRKVLVVASPTGTGWLDPGSHDPLEYMHGGDIATAATQYSYLQSPLALIFETEAGLEQATETLEVIHNFWKTLPPDDRPRLYVHGLSLGAWSSMYATNLFRLVDYPIHGAYWAGPPFPSRFWNYVQNARAPGSPWVLPTIGDGSLVRYASNVADASEGEADWGNMRIVFLQYSSDPIVFYDPYSVWRAPPWMNDPPAEDASEHMRFVPFVTQFQLALDMALSFGAPPGHGHAYYAQDYIAPWVQVSQPDGWTEEDTERLKAHCDNGFQRGCSNE